MLTERGLSPVCGKTRLQDSHSGAGCFTDDHEPEWATVDVSRVRVERMRDFGDVYLALALWRRLHLDRFFDEQMVSGKEDIPWFGTSFDFLLYDITGSFTVPTPTSPVFGIMT